ncbi:RDD family protein [Rubripirellula tenax]|uniref:RDD family protein n=1 Tax=Rubripirellula tenax TaxID=2528015 RepID=A0A5C6FGT2_9BACT|nr:RDD family protein [Rubripirellula tenax]TWU59296.1 RDD family protein [Rubripirellula tenax]
MSENPYASPNVTSDAAFNLDGQLNVDNVPVASQNKRLVNFFLDNIATQVISLAGGFLLGMVMVASSGGGNLSQSQATGMQFMGMFIGILLTLAYFAGMELACGATIGKLITGTRVVNATGGKAGIGQILGRSLARLIPFEPFSFLFGDKTTGWHDSLSGTRVVDIRKAR